MIDKWIIFSLIACVAWGIYLLISKVVVSKNYFGVNSAVASLLFLVGFGVVIFGYFISERGFEVPSLTTPQLSLTIIAGGLFALGVVFVFKTLAVGGDASRVRALVNTNTLVTLVFSNNITKRVTISSRNVKSKYWSYSHSYWGVFSKLILR